MNILFQNDKEINYKITKSIRMEEKNMDTAQAIEQIYLPIKQTSFPK